MRVYARELNEHLPSLRRYARALTGSVDRGDDLVTRCVEAAVMAPTKFGLPAKPSGPLYALLHALFDQDGEGRRANFPPRSDRTGGGVRSNPSIRSSGC